jgi:amidase
MSRQLFATDGLLTRTIEDLALLAPIMAQPSARDPRYTPASWDETPTRDVAVLAGEDLDPGPRAAMRRATEALEAAGYRVHETSVPHLERLAELWRDLLAYDSGPVALPRLRDGGCEGTKRFLEALLAIATPLDGPGYARALAERHVLAADWSAFFDRYPVLVGPVSTRDPWDVGHDLGGEEAARDEWWGFRLTVATSALGLPAISLPIGVQLLAGRWQEARLLKIAAALAQHCEPGPAPS